MNRYPNNIDHAQTIAFATLCMSELLRAFTARSEHYGIFSIGVFSNQWMIWAVLGSAAIVLLVIYVPFLQPFFDTTPLSLEDWLHDDSLHPHGLGCRGDHEGLYPQQSRQNGSCPG